MRISGDDQFDGHLQAQQPAGREADRIAGQLDRQIDREIEALFEGLVEPSAWTDPPRPTTRFARGSLPPRDVSVTFAPQRKPTTLQMAVPPMPAVEGRPSTGQIEPSTSSSGTRRASSSESASSSLSHRASSSAASSSESSSSLSHRAPSSGTHASSNGTQRASRSSDVDLPSGQAATQAPKSRRWAVRLVAIAIPAIALGAAAAVYVRGGEAASELDLATLPIAWPVAVTEGTDKVAQLAKAQGVREGLAAELAEAERGLAAHRTSIVEMQEARSQLDARRAELARVRRSAAEVQAAQSQLRPPRDPFAASTRSDTGPAYSPELAQRLAVLVRRSAQLTTEVRALEAQLVGRAERSHDVALARLAKDRDDLAARLVKQDLALAGLRALVEDPRVVAQVAFDQVPATGTRVFACRFQTLECREAGEVAAVRSEEIDLDHPYRGRMRGRLVELRLRDVIAGDSLYLGTAPSL